MHFLLLSSLIYTAVVALPTGDSLDKRQLSNLFGLGGGVKCGKVAVLFSRGTFEFGSNGMTVGPQFTTALQAMLPADTQFWGNDYDNNVVNYLIGGSYQGAKMMKDKAEEYASKCPGTKLVLSGYRYA
jgi:cutinase